jgi:type IV pilus assembly protein PilN
MIRINLLGDNTASDASAKLYIAGYVASILLCFGGTFLYYSNLSSEVAGLTREQETLQLQLNNLLVKTKTVRELEVKKKTLREKLSLIARLKKSKIGPVRVMDDLNGSLPSKVWLRELQETKGLLKFKGRAISNQDIAYFMQNLEKSDYFSSVELKESRQMYYSKRTGVVTPTADISQFRTADFGKDRRATKESPGKPGASSGKKWNIKRIGEGSANRKGAIEENNIKIKEFVIEAKVHYEGKLRMAATADSPEASTH